VQRHIRSKRLVVGTALAALVAITSQASAHVTVGVPTLSVTTLEFRAPVEPSFTTADELAAHHTESVSVSVPAGFKVEQCQETADYACTSTVDKATWTRRVGSTNFGLQTINGAPVQSPFGGLLAVEFFGVVVRTPGIGGTFRTPAIQTYSDGEVVSWVQPDPADPHPAPQIRVNGPDRAPAVAEGVFKPLSELGAGNPCPQSVIDEAKALGIDPAVHCSHFGFEPPAGSPAPPPPTGDELVIRGTAKLVRTATQTTVEVNVFGLEPGKTYASHLHEGTCADVTSAHYMDDLAGPDAPPNELWPSSNPEDPTAGLIADAYGQATGSGTVDWVARPTARAIWIHQPVDPNTPPGAHVHARIACADLV
jgi:uncharacterized protein YcnI